VWFVSQGLDQRIFIVVTDHLACALGLEVGLRLGTAFGLELGFLPHDDGLEFCVQN
jgi:hypothetical protein